jgi:hypothetical protein
MGIPRRLLAILPLAALLLAGCGGGGGEDETTASTPEITEVTRLTKAELIAQGDAICAEVNAAVGSAGSTSSGSAGQPGQVADLYDGMVERLKGLGPPSDDSAGYPEFIEAGEALAQAENDVGLAVERGEESTAAEAEASSALTSFQSAATAFGFEQCGEAPSAPAPSPAGEAPAGEEPAAGGIEGQVEEGSPEEELEAAPEEAPPPAEEESAGGGASAGGGTGGGAEGGETGGSSGGIGPG